MDRPVKSARPAAISLQDAKARFSEVVSAAMNGQAQHVTRRGKPAVVIVGASEFDRLSRGDRSPAHGFVDHLLAMPRLPTGRKGRDEPRPKLRPRDVDLSA